MMVMELQDILKEKIYNVYRVDAAEEAARMNSPKTFNMIVLGGFLKVKPIIKLENVIKGLKKSLPERYHNLIPMNEKALKRGEEIISWFRRQCINLAPSIVLSLVLLYFYLCVPLCLKLFYHKVTLRLTLRITKVAYTDLS